MKTVILSASLALLATISVASVASAQRPGGSRDPEAMMDRQMSRLTERLDLTAEQEEKVRPILQERFEKMMELRSQYQAGPTPEMREEMLKIRQDTTERLSKVLTKEQMKEYEKLQQERGGRFGDGGRRGGRGNR